MKFFSRADARENPLKYPLKNFFVLTREQVQKIPLKNFYALTREENPIETPRKFSRADAQRSPCIFGRDHFFPPDSLVFPSKSYIGQPGRTCGLRPAQNQLFLAAKP